jgi:hypothetical protein
VSVQASLDKKTFMDEISTHKGLRNNFYNMFMEVKVVIDQHTKVTHAVDSRNYVTAQPENKIVVTIAVFAPTLNKHSVTLLYCLTDTTFY